MILSLVTYSKLTEASADDLIDYLLNEMLEEILNKSNKEHAKQLVVPIKSHRSKKKLELNLSGFAKTVRYQ